MAKAEQIRSGKEVVDKELRKRKLEKAAKAEARKVRKEAEATATTRAPKPVIPDVEHVMTDFEDIRTYTYVPPSDFKPFFLEITFKTEQDGMLNLHNDFQVNYHRGRYDDDEKKKYDMWDFDPKTVASIFARMAPKLFHATGRKLLNKAGQEVPKRLEPNKVYRVVFRVLAKKDPNGVHDKIIGVILKHVFITKKVKSKATGESKVKIIELNTKDPYRRMFGGAVKFMACAFKEMLQPPKGRRKKKDEEIEDQEDY